MQTILFSKRVCFCAGVRPACAPPKFGAFWSCSSCSSPPQALQKAPCFKKPLAVESKGKGKAVDLPPSLTPHPVWEMVVETNENDLPIILQAVQLRAKHLLERLRTGGTEDPLRCLCYFVCRIAQLRLGSSVEEPSSSSMQIVDLPEQQKAPPADIRLHVVLIMDGHGRLKSSVKRSMTGLLQGAHNIEKRLDPFAESLLRTLRPQTFTWALAMERESQVYVNWRDSEQSCLKTYLMRRGPSVALAPAIAAEKVQLGVDLLGPKRPAPVQPPMPPLKMLKGPAVSENAQRAESQPQEPSRGPDPNMMRACAMFVAQNGEVTKTQAEATLKKLLLDLHDTTEELHRAKLELCFYKERDARACEVRMLSFSHLTRVRLRGGADAEPECPVCLGDVGPYVQLDLQRAMVSCRDVCTTCALLPSSRPEVFVHRDEVLEWVMSVERTRRLLRECLRLLEARRGF